MKVVRAQSAGACYGVKRALELAFGLAEKGTCAQTLGPLIHNPRVVEELEQRGIVMAHSPEDVQAHTVVIRSHGVTPEVMEQVESLGLDVVDATCPHVLRAQKAAMEIASKGMSLVVVGEEEHPEVQGLCAWARKASEGKADIHVVSSARQIPQDMRGPVGVVAQTTQTREVLEEVVGALESMGLVPVVRDTICDATTHRQAAARDLASTVDAMVVVGGFNSSNTKRLHEICAEAAPRAFHVESPADLRKEDFAGCEVVGLTAGASTPESQIVAIEDFLHSW